MDAMIKQMQEARRAVIYCRVSSTKQRREGHGLDSQEHRCRQYAAAKGYTVEAVFPDDVSGGGDFLKRPGMVALLAFLDAQKGKPWRAPSSPIFGICGMPRPSRPGRRCIIRSRRSTARSRSFWTALSRVSPAKRS